MKALIKLCKKTIALEKKANKIFTDILKDSNIQAQIVDLNLSQMYDGGIDSEGHELGHYAAITVSYYKPLASSLGNDGRSDHITLKDTGEFYKSFKIKITSEGFIIQADADKGDTDLSQIYPKVIGLTKENKAEVGVIVAPYLAEIIRKEILG